MPFSLNEIIRNEPRLKYAPFIAFNPFSSLLKTNPRNAYEYGKEVIVTATYKDPACDAIIGPIEWYSDKRNLPAEIYQLDAEAHQAAIDQFPYPEILNRAKRYSR